MKKVNRILIPLENRDERNILQQYYIQKAAWICHPEYQYPKPFVAEYRCKFEVDVQKFTMHISADEIFHLYIDGEYCGYGPDRGDFLNWYFTSYELELTRGQHEIRVLVSTLRSDAPVGQESVYSGLIIATEGLAQNINTGTYTWEVSTCPEISWYSPVVKGLPIYVDVGPSYKFNFINYKRNWIAPVISEPAIQSNAYGLAASGHNLIPAGIPEQILAPITDWNIVAYKEITAQTKYIEYQNYVYGSTKIYPYVAEDRLATNSHFKLADGHKQNIFKKNTTIKILLDLKTYYCAYAIPVFRGGRGATITISWAETLYDDISKMTKGDRSKFIGKQFVGFDDSYCADGAMHKSNALWWRAGRYIEITISVQEEELILTDFNILETRYPLQLNSQAQFLGDHNKHEIIKYLPKLDTICFRGIANSLHSTYTDSPYYEQMSYGGDTRIEILVTRMLSADPFAARHTLELFDFSRFKTGFSAERYPSRLYQSCQAFSMIYILTLSDFLWWHNDKIFTLSMLPGMRSIIDKFLSYIDEQKNILKFLPGWNFIDWAETWPGGHPPKTDVEASGPHNFLFIMALNAASKIEENIGEQIMADRYKLWAKRIFQGCIRIFFSQEKNIFADQVTQYSYSELTQTFALLANKDLQILEPHQEKTCLEFLKQNHSVSVDGVEKNSIYSMFYLLEVYKSYKLGDFILKRFATWQKIIDHNLSCPIEEDRPDTRSDCHAWGSHPSFHLRCSIAGLRPSKAFFEEIEIAPLECSIAKIKFDFPHHLGNIEIDLNLENESQGTINLPIGLKGNYYFKNKKISLVSGKNII